MMKLYTEQEVRKVISEAMFYHDTVDAHISKMTSIELPSDQEIKKGIKKEWNYSHYQDRHWMEEGAKWVLEQIKNQ